MYVKNEGAGVISLDKRDYENGHKNPAIWLVKYFTLCYSQFMEERDFTKYREAQRQAVRDLLKSTIRKTNNIAETARKLGVSRQTVYNWLKPVWEGKELIIKKRGRKRELSETQCQRLKVLISNDVPESIGLPFLLWSPKAVKMLIEREYDKSFTYETIGRFLRDWGFIPTGSASIYWSDKATHDDYGSEKMCLSDYINKTNALSYYMGVYQYNSHPNCLSTHTIFAFTKNGHVKFMNVKWSRNVPKTYSKQNNSDKYQDFTLFLKRLKRQSHRNLVVIYVKNKIKKHAGGILLPQFEPEGVRVLTVSTQKRTSL